MKKIWLCLAVLLFLSVLPAALAYPIGISPGTQKICAEDAAHKLLYFNFYNGALTNKTFTIHIANLTWISFYDGTMLQSGEIDVEGNSSVDIPVYAKIPSNLQDGVYNATLYVCTIPPANETLKIVYCVPGKMMFNVTTNCPQQDISTYNQSVIEVANENGQQGANWSWIMPYAIIIIAAAFVLGLKKLNILKI